MRELSLHILDIAENGITAGADCIHILVEEARTADLLTIKITDNGQGMPGRKNRKTDRPVRYFPYNPQGRFGPVTVSGGGGALRRQTHG